MLTFLKQFYGRRTYQLIEEYMPPAKAINSFDCARFSMGVVQILFDPLVMLPLIRLEGLSAADRITVLLAHVQLVNACLDNLLAVAYIGVWNLDPTRKAEHAWDVAPPLKRRLHKMDEKFGSPDTFIYEFQMGANDKSRMVSTMLAFHYSGTATIRIAPAVKNTITVARRLTRSEFRTACHQVAVKKKKSAVTGKMSTVIDLIYPEGDENRDLSIQTFLAIVTDTYDANKLHTSASLLWWAHYFHIDLRWVPQDCLDDAADAFMQTLGAFRQRSV